ncbi:hypothetical protein [Fusobacterium sp. PH5-44]|uniref:hypothetical protein n=1 Tax=unclassified Fusobacterium TaxID=2648384 RepID=UPI003D24E667
MENKNNDEVTVNYNSSKSAGKIIYRLCWSMISIPIFLVLHETGINDFGDIKLLIYPLISIIALIYTIVNICGRSEIALILNNKGIIWKGKFILWSNVYEARLREKGITLILKKVIHYIGEESIFSDEIKFTIWTDDLEITNEKLFVLINIYMEKHEEITGWILDKRYYI